MRLGVEHLGHEVRGRLGGPLLPEAQSKGLMKSFVHRQRLGAGRHQVDDARPVVHVRCRVGRRGVVAADHRGHPLADEPFRSLGRRSRIAAIVLDQQNHLTAVDPARSIGLL